MIWAIAHLNPEFWCPGWLLGAWSVIRNTRVCNFLRVSDKFVVGNTVSSGFLKEKLMQKFCMLSLHYYVFYNKKTSWQLKVFQKRPGFFLFLLLLQEKGWVDTNLVMPRRQFLKKAWFFCMQNKWGTERPSSHMIVQKSRDKMWELSFPNSQ